MPTTRFAQGSAATAVAAGDPKLPRNGSRKAITFSLTGAFPVFLWPIANPAATDGLQVNAGSPILTLRECDHGPLVQSDWYASSPGGASSVAWCEVLTSDPRGE